MVRDHGAGGPPSCRYLSDKLHTRTGLSASQGLLGSARVAMELSRPVYDVRGVPSLRDDAVLCCRGDLQEGHMSRYAHMDGHNVWQPPFSPKRPFLDQKRPHTSFLNRWWVPAKSQGIWCKQKKKGKGRTPAF